MRASWLFLVSFILIAVAEVAVSSPYVPVVYQRDLPADVQVLAYSGAGYVACLSTGECLLVNASGGEITARGNFLGMSFSQILRAGSSLLFVGSFGNLLTVNPTNLSQVASFNLLLQGEIEVTRAVLSSDGRYLALTVRHRVQGYTQDKLVVVDLARRVRVFERDYSSSDPLVYAFSLDRWEEFFIVEDINTSCHICQLTDNMIEVYRFGPQVQKVARRQTGLTRFKVIVGNYLLLQRAEDNTLLALSLPSLEVSSSAKFQPVRQAVSDGNQVFLVTERDELFACSPNLDCRSLGTVPPRSLVAALSGYIVVFSIPQVQVYMLRAKLEPVLTYEISWSFPPSPPSMVLGDANSAVALYPGRRILGVFLASTAKLLVRTVEESGKPIANATVTVLCRGVSATKVTGPDGYAVFEVPLGGCAVKVEAQYFSEWSTELDVNGLYVNVTAVLKKKEVPTATLLIVVEEDGDSAVRIPGAALDIRGPVNLNAATNASGAVRLRVPLGSYTIEATAPGYLTLRQNLTVTGGNQSFVIRLKPKLSTLTLTVAGGGSAVVRIGEREYRVNQSEVLHLKPGEYTLLVLPPCRANVTPTLVLDGERNFSLIIECGSLASEKAVSIGSLTRFLRESTISSESLNMSVEGLIVDLLNGSRVDLVSLSYGRAVVIELFYTQCSGCKYLLPALRQIAAWGNVSVFSLTVSRIDDARALSYYVRENNVTWPVGWAPSSIRDFIGVASYPTVLVLSEGRVVFKGVGARGELNATLGLANNSYSSILIELLSRVMPAESYPAMLFIVGLALTVVSLALGGRGGAEEQEESYLSAHTVALHSIEPSLRSAALDSLTWPLEAAKEHDENEVVF